MSGGEGENEAFEARLRAFLHEARVEAEHRVFDRSCHSVAEAARAADAPEDLFVKSICFLREDGALLVAVVKGEDRASATRVANALGLDAKPRLATADEILARAGYPAGGVPPFGFDAAAWLVDERVMEKEKVWAGGGSPRALVRVAPAELLRACGGRVARVRR